MTEKNTNEEQIPRQLSSNKPYAGTPGAAYVDDFLPGFIGDDHWLADSVNAGALVVCQRCHFLHLPGVALPLLLRSIDPLPVDACDVCAHMPSAAELDFVITADMMLQAREQLGEARVERAQIFYDLWMGASNAADTWVLASLGNTLAGVKEASRTDAGTGSIDMSSVDMDTSGSEALNAKK